MMNFTCRQAYVYRVEWRDNENFLVWWCDRTQTRIKVMRYQVDSSSDGAVCSISYRIYMIPLSENIHLSFKASAACLQESI